MDYKVLHLIEKIAQIHPTYIQLENKVKRVQPATLLSKMAMFYSSLKLKLSSFGNQAPVKHNLEQVCMCTTAKSKLQHLNLTAIIRYMYIQK